MRREKAPQLVGRRLTACAASRKAWPARLPGLSGLRRQTWPPAISWRGAHPHQDQNAFMLGHVCRSRPISERLVCTVLACRPGMAIKSTPVS